VDAGGNAIRKLDTSGKLITVAGQDTICAGRSASGDGIDVAGRIDFADAVAIDDLVATAVDRRRVSGAADFRLVAGPPSLEKPGERCRLPLR
jgi:hypothetical protein